MPRQVQPRGMLRGAGSYLVGLEETSSQSSNQCTSTQSSLMFSRTSFGAFLSNATYPDTAVVRLSSHTSLCRGPRFEHAAGLGEEETYPPGPPVLAELPPYQRARLQPEQREVHLTHPESQRRLPSFEV